jgi:hypothetical protein
MYHNRNIFLFAKVHKNIEKGNGIKEKFTEYIELIVK